MIVIFVAILILILHQIIQMKLNYHIIKLIETIQFVSICDDNNTLDNELYYNINF